MRRQVRRDVIESVCQETLQSSMLMVVPDGHLDRETQKNDWETGLQCK